MAVQEKGKFISGLSGVCAELLKNLGEVFAEVDSTDDNSLYELATAIGQAKRAVRARLPGWNQLKERLYEIERIFKILVPNDAKKRQVFACLDEGALLGQLEELLADSDTERATLLATLYDVDEHLLVALFLGLTADPTFLRDAITLIQVHNDTAAKVAGLAKAFRTQYGVMDGDPAFPLWEALAESKPDSGELQPEPILPGIAAYLERQARRS